MLTLLPLLFAPLLTAQDETWPQFLGPNGAAVAGTKPASLDFDLERDLLWRAALPSGSSSPCIWGDKLFITGSTEDQLVMLAFNRKTGELLWRRTRELPELGPVAHVDAIPAVPTPCTDGERVVFYFGAYGLVVLDLDGELLWQKELPVPPAPFGIGTSPILVGDALILSRDGCDDSAIYALEKSNGAELWRRPRFGFTYSFGTPFVWNNSKGRELVVAGTQRLSGLDPVTGEELWHLSGLTSFVCTTPTADGDTLYFAAWSTSDAAPDERGVATWGDYPFTAEERADAGRIIARLDANGDGQLEFDEIPVSRARDAFSFLDRNGNGLVTPEELAPLVEQPKGRGNNLMVAVAAGGKGDIKDTHVRWTHRRGLPYVASPLLYQGRLFLAKAGGLVTCLDAEGGGTLFGPERLEDHSEYYASPVGVDGHVILCSSDGTITVLRGADEFEVVRSVELGAAIHATPAVVDGTIYVRSERELWAFGKN
jgi:outer membrane protein assembly factor BamB